jgi:hypothetical protein
MRLRRIVPFDLGVIQTHKLRQRVFDSMVSSCLIELAASSIANLASKCKYIKQNCIGCLITMIVYTGIDEDFFV